MSLRCSSRWSHTPEPEPARAVGPKFCFALLSSRPPNSYDIRYLDVEKRFKKLSMVPRDAGCLAVCVLNGLLSAHYFARERPTSFMRVIWSSPLLSLRESFGSTAMPAFGKAASTKFRVSVLPERGPPGLTVHACFPCNWDGSISPRRESRPPSSSSLGVGDSRPMTTVLVQSRSTAWSFP